MRHRPTSSSFGSSFGMSSGGFGALGLLPPTGPATRLLCFLLLATSVLAALLERYSQGGSKAALMLQPSLLPTWELWRYVSYAFLEPTPGGVLLSALWLWLMGRFAEWQMGSGAYGRFFVLSCAGAGLLAGPFGTVLGWLLPFDSLPLLFGPRAGLDALLVAMAVQAPKAEVYLGFMVPLSMRQILYWVLGIEVLTGLMTGSSSLGLTLGGMLMGYVLSTGIWRPKMALAAWQRWRAQRRFAQQIYIVPPPRRPQKTTWHRVIE